MMHSILQAPNGPLREWYPGSGRKNRASHECEVKSDFRHQIRCKVERIGKGIASGGDRRIRRNGISYM